MFDINYYNEKFKENLGSIGGSTPSEGVSNWVLWGSATGTNKITLPTEYSEVMFIVRNTSGSDMTTRRIHYSLEELTIMKDDTLKQNPTYTERNIYTEDITSGLSDVNYILTYYFNDNSIAIKTHKGQTPSDIYQLSVYYKKKSPITVNVGTESNWELWGEVTGTKQIALPSDYSEIMILCKSTSTGTAINLSTSFTYQELETIISEYLDLYPSGAATVGLNFKDIVTQTERTDSSMTLDIKTRKIYLSRFINSSPTSEHILSVYYKKKCDNVLDINDMGEWKLVGSASTDNGIQLPNEFKELLVLTEGTGTTLAPFRFSKIIPKEALNYETNYILFFGNTYIYNSANYLCTWKLTNATPNILSLHAFTSGTSNHINASKTTVYYR